MTSPHVKVRWLAYDLSAPGEIKLVAECEKHTEAHRACRDLAVSVVMHVEIQMPYRRHDYRPPPRRPYRSPDRHGDKWWDKD